MDPASIMPSEAILLTTTISTTGQLVGWGIMVTLIMCSALISGSEVAYFSLTPAQQSDLKEEKDRSSKRILKLLEKPKKLLATILIANNFVNVGIIILSAFLIEPYIPVEWGPGWNIAVKTIGITFVILLLGEVIPKVYATKYGMSLARVMSSPLLRLRWLFSWLSRILIGSTSIIEKRLAKKNKEHTIEELETALELTRDQNTNEEEHKLLEGIVRFGSTDVRQIMTPRTDVVAFDMEDDWESIIPSIIESGYSRIPAYEESFDKVAGILYIKDLLPHIDDDTAFEWQQVIRPPFFVPEHKKIDDLLREFQEKKIHLAVVVDEYGGTSGIVTLEDIIEEILGEISDEFDDDDLAYSKIDDSNYVFEAKIALNDLYRVLDCDDTPFEESKGDSETLGGFMLELFGKIPQKNEKVKFEHYTFTIETADPRKVKRVKVTIHEVEEAAEDDE